MLCMSVACTPEEEIITSDMQAKLTFSQDTVLFDTLFSTIGSTTQFFKVYNPNRKAVQITSVRLSDNSAYKVYVNGEQNTDFDNIRLLGGDSLLVLVEVLINPQDKDLPFLVKDSLVFTTNQNVQDVKLIAWGQDAHFLKGPLIKKDTTFAGQRPYVISDSLWIGPGATLSVEKGVRLYFSRGSGVVVHGSLQAKGTAEERVVFTNDRTDGDYANGMGQWLGMFFGADSQGNQLNYADIRNADVGLFVEGDGSEAIPDISLAHTKIENMSVVGIAAINANIEAYNVLADNCGVNLIRHWGGGRYRYVHCTFANGFNSLQGEASLLFADTAATNTAMYLTLERNIIWGNRSDELIVVKENPASVAEITNNLIRTRTYSFPESNVVNENPQFIAPFEYDYHLDSTSAAIDKGKLSSIITDLEGQPRDTLPDLGAYEYIKK